MYQVSSIKYQVFRKGFSLIEILIVIAIFGLTVSLVTASFLTFERNQRLRNAALQLKSDLRQAQNKALSGDKGSGSSVCPASSTLGGWCMQISTDAGGDNNTKNTMSGDCRTGAADSAFGSRTILLPQGITVSATSLGVGGVNILFQPLASGVSYHNAALTPPFFNASGNLLNQIGSGNTLTITLTSATGSGTYQVVILPSGEVNDSKP